MTTTSAAVAGIGTGLARLTIHAGTGRCDMAVPYALTVADLLPLLVRRTGSPPGEYALERLGDPPLALEPTVQELDLQDGEVLYLRPAGEPLPVLDFDDVADGVATVISAGGGRWRPELTGRLLLGLAALPLAALVPTLLGLLAGGPAWHAAAARSRCWPG